MTAHKEENKSEFKEKVLFVNRCSKVVKGGRKFSFSALVIVGDHQGTIGSGFAKANEVADAIRKATEKARKETFKVKAQDGTLFHDVEGKSDGSHVILKRAKAGTGLIAGSTTRSVLEMCGYTDVVAKSIGRSCHGNVLRATIKALQDQLTGKESSQKGS